MSLLDLKGIRARMLGASSRHARPEQPSRAGVSALQRRQSMQTSPDAGERRCHSGNRGAVLLLHSATPTWFSHRRKGKRAESVPLRADRRNAARRSSRRWLLTKEIFLTERFISAANIRSWTAIPSWMATEVGRRRSRQEVDEEHIRPLRMIRWGSVRSPTPMNATP